MFEECFGDGPFVFRINENGSGPALLTQVCLERGWREYNPETNEHWNLWWRTSGFPVNHHRNLYAWQVPFSNKFLHEIRAQAHLYKIFQYINHIPKTSSICRKDNLVRYMRCMKKIYGPIYDFSPHGYNLPLEYTKLAAECSRAGGGGVRPVSTKSDNMGCFDEKPIWICKPVAQSQGKGIFLFRKLSELSYDSNTIVQRYIEKPLLIGGYKFDLRLYVCIPSYHPVTIYLYREGLARFGTDKFSLNDLRNPFRHLTNSSINKLGPGYTEMKDRIGSGCKWSLRQLRRYFQQAGISDWLLWQRISALVILTVISHVSPIPPTVNCFEFFGFDVLIDDSLRPWLLEVNLSPALSNDCDTDRIVKKPMLHDMFDLLGLPVYNTGLSVFDLWSDSIKDENSKNKLDNTLSIVSAAGRWRRKQKKISARLGVKHRKSNSRPVSSFTKTSPNRTTIVRILRSKCCNYKFSFQINDDSKCAKKWGNGRDWNYAPNSEGGWTRIWPISVGTPIKQPTNTKCIVNNVIKFIKTAKDLVRNHQAASECQLNEFLQQELDISGENWMPVI